MIFDFIVVCIDTFMVSTITSKVMKNYSVQWNQVLFHS